MNKKIILLPAALLLLASCGPVDPNTEMPSIAPSVSLEPSPVPSVVPPSVPELPSVTPSTPEDTSTPEARHADYLAKWEASSSASSSVTSTIRVKVLGYQKYPGNTTGNFYFQEDKYGYWINNVPMTAIEVGKSYEITAEHYYGEKAKSYPCMKYYQGTWEATEIGEVATTPYVLGEATTDTSSQAYKDGQYSFISLGDKTATVTAVALTGDYPSFSFTIDGGTGTTYKWSSNDGIESWTEISTKLADLQVGDKLHRIQGGWGGNYGGATATDIIGSAAFEVGANPTTITLSGDNTVQVAQTKQLTATLAPTYAIENLTWSSSDTSKLTVTQNGEITGVATGTATVTATGVNGVVGTKTITISDTLAPTALTISGPTTVGQTNTIQFAVESVTPTGANADVTWRSSNTAVATIDADGLLKGLSQGTTEVTAVSALDNQVISNAITVTVTGLALPLTGMFDDVQSEKVVMPEGWDADPYDSPYGYTNGIKLNKPGSIVKSPKFVAVQSVDVGLIINKLNANTKTAGGLDAFLIEALNNSGTVVGTTTLGAAGTLTAGQTAVATVAGTDIVQIRITFQDYYTDGSTVYNINWGGVTLTETAA